MRSERLPPPEILAAIRAPFAVEAATPVDPPVVQPLNLFLDLAGEAMRARLFVVQAEGREEACLRPDLTIPAARAHIAAGAASGRYVYEGKAFRASPRGEAAGHPEEFLQLGLEAYGPASAAEEAALVGLAWRSASAGRRGDLSIRLGDAALFVAFLTAIGAPAAAAARLRRSFGRTAALEAELARAEAPSTAGGGGELARLLSTLPEREAAGLLEELWSLAGIQPVGGRPAAEIVHRLVERGDAEAAPRLTRDQVDAVRAYVAVSGDASAALAAIESLAPSGALAAPLAAWRERLGALPEAPVTFSAGFGRAFGYYDGFLFDILSAALGEGRPVAGGGRYDGLLTRLGGQAAGAIGCMVRPGRAWKEGGE